ncbi:unnamed protein product [Rangifer tarandus platyrhynchus]|uniref:Uncharacterized protein n=2 Tax=Rangifer tarandus platyrhynchus TaxID=3082113 RepID=A0ACB0DYX5_RANTA|nr:unnamed protein product [Rangifer tarandus platyrhynchus]CAI9693542.1 unnamed protein product [Rangifer tarandus platyrhynchus]
MGARGLWKRPHPRVYKSALSRRRPGRRPQAREPTAVARAGGRTAGEAQGSQDPAGEAGLPVLCSGESRPVPPSLSVTRGSRR